MVALIVLGASVALLGTALAACGSDDTAAADGRVQVVASTPVVADLTRQIGGERLDLHTLIGVGVDPHEHEATPADADAIGRADLVVISGAGFDAFLDPLLDQADTVVDASTGIHLRQLEGSDDPHIWHDPTNAMAMVATIAAALEKADPAHAAEYRTNAATLTTELTSLDAELAAEYGALTNRKIVTDHDALGYLADHYHLEIVGSVIPSFDSSAEMSARDVTDLVEKIRSTGVTAVFAEAGLPAKAAKAVAEEAGVEVVTGENAIYADSLGPEDSDAATYQQMVRHNAHTITSHLQ